MCNLSMVTPTLREEGLWFGFVGSCSDRSRQMLAATTGGEAVPSTAAVMRVTAGHLSGSGTERQARRPKNTARKQPRETLGDGGNLQQEGQQWLVPS